MNLWTYRKGFLFWKVLFLPDECKKYHLNDNLYKNSTSSDGYLTCQVRHPKSKTHDIASSLQYYNYTWFC